MWQSLPLQACTTQLLKASSVSSPWRHCCTSAPLHLARQATYVRASCLRRAYQPSADARQASHLIQSNAVLPDQLQRPTAVQHCTHAQ